jgi:hypothetical protein
MADARREIISFERYGSFPFHFAFDVWLAEIEIGVKKAQEAFNFDIQELSCYVGDGVDPGDETISDVVDAGVDLLMNDFFPYGAFHVMKSDR